MLTFLRRIRISLIESGSTRKYLLYAIGEIVLVVMGILIALQINNWNEARKDRKLERSFLIRLQKDLVVDTIYLNNRLKRAKLQRASQYEFVHEIYNNQSTEDDFKRVFSLQRFGAENLVMQTSTFEELKNAGLINLIQHERLKIGLINLYREYEVAAEHINEINNFTSRELFGKSIFVIQKYHHPDLYDEKRLFEGTDWKFINDPSSEDFKLLENTQMGYYVKYGFFIVHFENLLTQSKSLIDQIETELDTR